MKTSEIVNVSIGLSVTPPSQAGFTVGLLLVDHSDIPIDRRYRQVTRSSHSSDLTTGTDQSGWCTALWGQNYNPAQAYIGRWVSAASSPYIYFGSPVTTIATWTAVTTGYLKITDGTNSDEIGPLNFSAVTSMSDVCTVIQTALQAIAVPNITGLDTATCALDKLDRVVITNSTTGASASTISTTAASTGIDLRGTGYLGPGVSQAGLDAESLGTALNAILALDDTPYLICQRGATIAQEVAFSTVVQSLAKFYYSVNDDADAKDSTSTTDAPYQIEALGHNKTWIVYTEHTTNNGAAADQYPDAAAIGEINTKPNSEGAISNALTPLGGLSESGLKSDGTTVIPLTVTERTALEAKGTDYLVNPAGSVHARHGLAAGGQEVRVMIGKEFMGAKISEDWYAYLLANDVVTFSDPDLKALLGIIQFWFEEMASRKLLDDTTFDFSNFPTASDFTAAERATHTMTISDAASAEVLQSVNDTVLSLSFSV
jgi:hypothetical protein